MLRPEVTALDHPVPGALPALSGLDQVADHGLACIGPRVLDPVSPHVDILVRRGRRVLGFVRVPAREDGVPHQQLIRAPECDHLKWPRLARLSSRILAPSGW
jgi:hypothetical protein